MTGNYTIKFIKQWSKLENNEFTTIRKFSNYYRPGQVATVETPVKIFKAVVFFVRPIKKSDITENIARLDADCSREELLVLLERFYGNHEEFVLLGLRRVEN